MNDSKFVVITLGSLNLALPASELVLINEREKITIKNGITMTQTGDWQVPVYQLNEKLSLNRERNKKSLYCAVFSDTNKRPLWGLVCDQITQRNTSQQPVKIPKISKHPHSPLISVIVDNSSERDSDDNLIFTTTTQALTHYLERSLSNDHQDQSINLAC